QEREFEVTFRSPYNTGQFSRDYGYFNNVLLLEYNSTDFSDISPGLYVNRSVYNTEGWSTISIESGDTLRVKANTLLPIFEPKYQFELKLSSGQNVQLQIEERDSSVAYIYLPDDQSLNSADTLLVRDTANGFI